MVGITCALYDEAYELIKLLRVRKEKSIHHYVGNIGCTEVSLFLTRPGLKKNKKNFLQWLEMYPFSTLIHTGYCGALTNEYCVGDICYIDKVASISNKKVFNISADNGNHHLLTVKQPVITMEDRENPQFASEMNLVDMETWHICNQVSEMKNSRRELNIRVIKIVGDIPGETLLMQSEVKMRSFFSSRGIIKKTKIAISTGIPFLNLYARKRMLQKTLKSSILKEIIKNNVTG